MGKCAPRWTFSRNPLLIDDMYMLTILQLEAYRATGDRKYLDRDARRWYLSRQAAATQRAFLSRAGREVLLGTWRRLVCGRHGGDAALPAGWTTRDRHTHHEGYLGAMMAALLKYQGKDGMWRS